jgi:hypothetical protein
VDEQFARAKKELEASFARLNAGQRSRLAVDFTEAKAGSERATAILRPLETSLNTAVEALNSVQRQTKDVEQALASADTADQTLETLKDSLTEPMQAARKTGKQQLAQARDRLVAGQKTQNPAAVADALKYAQSASTSLTQLLDQVQKAARGVFEQQLADAIRVADEAFARVSGAMSILDGRIVQRPDIASPKLTADRAAYVKQVDGLRRKFERARKAEDLSGLAETTRLTLEARNGVTGLITAFGPITLRERGVHESLEEGVRLYLNGEYQQALSALEPLTGQTEVPLQVHAHVVRAAALYALFVRSGETNAQLRTDALAEIARTKQLNASFQPSPRAFSPRFLSLYQTGR